MTIQFLFYIIYVILLMFLDRLLGLFLPLSFSSRDIAPTFCDPVLVLITQQDLITRHLQIVRVLGLGPGGPLLPLQTSTFAWVMPCVS
jgi:hypothetical protein